MSCPCNKPQCVGELPANVLKVINECDPVLFHRVDYPASLGDDTTVPADTLDYKNVLLVYAANNHAYLYSSDGIPTFISMGDTSTEAIEQAITELKEEITNLSDTTAQQLADTNNALANLDEVVAQNSTTIEALQGKVDSLEDTATGTADILAETNQDVATLKTDVATNTQSIGQLQSAVEDNTQDLAGLRLTVGTNTSDITAIQDKQVVKDFSVSSDASTVSINKERGKLGAGEAPGVDVPLPVASSEAAGVMNSATYNAVQENSEHIDSILNGAVAVENIRSDVTQAQLTVVWKQNTGKTELINRASIYDITNKKIWTYYTNKQEWLEAPAGEVDVTVSQATNDALGIVKGSTEDGQVAVEVDGTMSLNGYDGIQADLENLTELINSGSITDAERAKLNSMLEIKSLNDSLELDENGQLSVVGGGSSVNLLSEYTDSPTTEDAYSASYVNSRLNGRGVRIGSGASANDNMRGVAIGENAKAGNYAKPAVAIGFGATASGNSAIAIGCTYGNYHPTAAGDNSIAIGYNANASNADTVALGVSSSVSGINSLALGGGAKCPHDRSIALGASTETTRANEVSIGGYTGTVSGVPKTRYLANVTAGELDTDAVNLKQMQDYVAEHAGGGSQLTDAEVTKVQNLGTGSLTNMEGVLQTEDEVQIEFTRQNLVAGGSATQTATIAAATTEEAGVMTPAMVAQLNQIGDIQAVLETLTTGEGV